jgi:HSP20 family molecular chaperone IbpA
MNASHDDVTQATEATEAVMAPQSVPVNVYEASGALVILAPMAAVTPGDVQVELHPGSPACVRFWAHVRSSGPREYLVREWEYGGYERQVDIPAGYGAGVEATLKNGQLVIRLLRGAPTSRVDVTPG